MGANANTCTFSKMAPSLCVYHFFVVNQVLLCFRAGGQNWVRTGEPTADHFVSRGGWFSGEFDFNPVIKELFFLVEADRDRPMLIDSIDGMHYVFQMSLYHKDCHILFCTDWNTHLRLCTFLPMAHKCHIRYYFHRSSYFQNLSYYYHIPHASTVLMLVTPRGP